jgi:hypothetical protein
MGIGRAIQYIAETGNGIVTTRDIVDMGFSESALRQYARRNPETIEKLGYGVYQFLDPDGETDINLTNAGFAAALALAGPDSYLTGSSVLDYYNLANANPEIITIRTPHKVRRKFPPRVRVATTGREEEVDSIGGIRMQNLAAAFREATDTRLDYRLRGLEDAEARNLINADQARILRKELERKKGR